MKQIAIAVAGGLTYKVLCGTVDGTGVDDVLAVIFACSRPIEEVGCCVRRTILCDLREHFVVLCFKDHTELRNIIGGDGVVELIVYGHLEEQPRLSVCKNGTIFIRLFANQEHTDTGTIVL